MDYDNQRSEPHLANTLALFDPVPVQTIMTSHRIIQIKPVNQNINTATTIEFEFPLVSTSTYYDFTETTLNMDFRTETNAGANPAATATLVKGAFINMPTSSFFSDVRLVIYDKPCESTGGMYHYQSMIHDMLSYDREYKNEVMHIRGYFDEGATKNDDAPSAAANVGYTKRRALVYTSENFIGTINLGLFRQPLKIPGYVKMKLIFTKAPSSFTVLDPEITGGDNTAPALKFNWENLYIETRQVDVVPSVFNSHLTGLKTQNFMFHIRRELTVTETIAAGSNNKTWNQVFPTSQLPTIIVMTLVQSSAFTGDPKYNPFCFDHFKLSYAKLCINSMPYPNADAYEPVWTGNKFMREYKSLWQFGGPDGCGITPYAYANGHFFLVWNLCPDLLTAGAAETVKPGTVSLEIKFAENLTKSINIIMYGMFDNTIEITHDKEVIRNWV